MSFDFASLKKPLEYGDGKGTVVNRPLTPAEMHQNLVALGQAIADLENGGGSGDGLFNCLSNGKFESDTTGWFNGTGLAIARTTTAAEILSGAASAKITKDAVNRAGSYLYSAFTLENRFKGQTLQLEFDYKALTNYTSAGLFEVQIYDTAAGAFLPMTLNAIPGGSGKFISKFSTGSNANLVLRIKVADTNTSTAIQEILIDNVRIGEDVTAVGAIVSGWTTYTPTIGVVSGTPPTKGTVVTDKAIWRRVGDSIEIIYKYVQNGAGVAGSGTYTVGLPPGLTINYAALPNYGTTNKLILGEAVLSSQGSSSDAYLNQYTDLGQVILDSSGAIVVSYINVVGTQESLTGFWGSTSYGFAAWPTLSVSMRFMVPIAGWGSNINLVSDFQEFASNSSATDADDLTSFAYGPTGSAGILGINLTGNRTKRVRFNRPIQSTDTLVLEFYNSSAKTWISAQSTPMIFNKGSSYCGVILRAFSGTDVDVVFHQYAVIDGTGWAGSGYSAWRVRKISNGNTAESPPGGIYESGSNQYGYFIKWVDGTMEQWGQVACTAYPQPIVFPQPFAATDYQVFPTWMKAGTANTNSNVNPDSKTLTGCSVWNYAGAGQTTGIQVWRAVGKWSLSRVVTSPGTVYGDRDALVYVYANRGASVSIAAGGTVIPFDEVEDASNSYNPTTGTFTAPMPGLYSIDAAVLWTSIAHAANACKRLYVVKNSVYVCQDRWEVGPAASCYVHSKVNIVIRLAAGDTIQIKAVYDQGATTTYVDNAKEYTWLHIARLGA